MVKIKREDFEDNPNKNKVLRYFRDSFTEYWIPINDVVDDLNMKYSTVRKYLNALTEDGILDKKEQQNEDNNGRTVYYLYVVNSKKSKERNSK
jgi:predicted transcriptional regulator